MSWIKILFHSGRAQPFSVENLYKGSKLVVEHRASMMVRCGEHTSVGPIEGDERYRVISICPEHSRPLLVSRAAKLFPSARLSQITQPTASSKYLPEPL